MFTNRPICVTPPIGKNLFCTCGFSSNKPYCDGGHKSQKTDAKPAPHTSNKSQRMVVCDCGKSSLLPFCDGHHNHCAVEINS